MSSAKVLDYYDILLRAGDVELLRQQHAWLNDQVISFVFEYLARERYAANQELCLVGGSMTYFFTKAGVADAKAIAEPLKLPERELVLLAVNDNPDISTAEGGGHWSLLTYTRHDSNFRHFDSAGGLNTRVARALAEVLTEVVSSESYSGFEDIPAPRQANGYDCGIYVLAMADSICQQWRQGRSWDDISMQLITELSPDRARAYRQTLFALVQEKTNEQVGGTTR